MVQFECPSHWNSSISSILGVWRIPFSQYLHSGVIGIGLPLWKWKSYKIWETKLAQQAGNGAVWMPQALKHVPLSHSFCEFGLWSVPLSLAAPNASRVITLSSRLQLISRSTRCVWNPSSLIPIERVIHSPLDNTKYDKTPSSSLSWVQAVIVFDLQFFATSGRWLPCRCHSAAALARAPPSW